MILHKDKLKEGLRDEAKDETVEATKHKKQSCACAATFCVKFESVIIHIMMSEIMMLVNIY